MLEPDEEGDNLPMTQDDLRKLFSSGPRPDGQEPPDAEEQDDGEAEVDINDAAQEAENLLHEHPGMQGDGADYVEDLEQEGNDEADDADNLNAMDGPNFIVDGPQLPDGIGEDPALILDDADAFSDGEILVHEAPFKNAISHQPPNDGPPIISSSASSSKNQLRTYGLNVTPDEARARLPPRDGCKIQHRRAKKEDRCSGWQAWPGANMPSKFFSYGITGRYSDSSAAMEAALGYCWDEHLRLQWSRHVSFVSAAVAALHCLKNQLLLQLWIDGATCCCWYMPGRLLFLLGHDVAQHGRRSLLL